MDAILWVLVAEHIRGAVLSDNPTGKSRHHDRRSHEGSVGKFLVVANRSHTTDPCLAVVKHPAIHNWFCGHKQIGRVAAATRLNPKNALIASINSRRGQPSPALLPQNAGRTLKTGERIGIRFLFGEVPRRAAQSFFLFIKAASCTLRPVRYTSPAL